MIKPIQKYLNFLNKLIDLGLIVLSYFAATYLWLLVISENPVNMARDLRSAWIFALVYGLISLVIYHIMGLYDALRARPVGKEVGKVLAANLLSTLIVAAALYIFRLQEFSRGVVATFYALSSLLIIGKRLVMRYTLGHFRKLGYNQKFVIVVGDGHLAEQYCASIRQNPDFGYQVYGYIGVPDRLPGVTCLGGMAALPGYLDGPGIDEVIAALEPESVRTLPEVIQATEKQGTKVSIIPFYNDYLPSSMSVETVGETKLFNVRVTPLDNVLYAAVKRTGDILLSLLLILLSSPVMLLAAVGTKLSSPGPVVFRQERVGLNKKIFVMYKFRSMRVNSEKDTAWTRDVDPRKTRFGSFLRKTSIDELPQFFNVLKGDMSIVGPRPEIPHFVYRFRETIPLYMLKHRVRPGITGWAQVNGYRGDTSIEERVKCDIWYIDNWSVWLDVRILFRTVFGGMVNREKIGAQAPEENREK